LALASNTLILSVMALQAEYAGLIDDDRLEDWPQLFVEDCVYKVISRENADRGMDIATIYCSSRAMLVDRVVSLRQANIFRSIIIGISRARPAFCRPTTTSSKHRRTISFCRPATTAPRPFITPKNISIASSDAARNSSSCRKPRCSTQIASTR
jgi:hypothetical protein